MSVRAFAKLAEKYASDNAPAILTGVGIAGTITTAVLTGKATFKAADLIREEQDNRNLHEIAELREFPTRDKIGLVWKLYIPPVVVGFTTVVSILGSVNVSTKRTAAMAAAYSLSEKKFGQYRDKVVETLTADKEEKIRAEVGQDKLNANPPKQEIITALRDQDVLCYDNYTGRYFKSDMEALRRAENDINRQILNHDEASLTDFYEKIGISPTKFSDQVGWSTSSDQCVLRITGGLVNEDTRPVLVVDYDVTPLRGRPFR